MIKERINHKMIYQDIMPIARKQAELILSEQRSDSKLICDTLLRVTYYEPDIIWVQEQCVELCQHNSVDVRRTAVICLGHLARLYEKLNMELVKPVLHSLLKDNEISGCVQDTLDDINMYIKPDVKNENVIPRFVTEGYALYKDEYTDFQNGITLQKKGGMDFIGVKPDAPAWAFAEFEAWTAMRAKVKQGGVKI